jgi:hypothetical protein
MSGPGTVDGYAAVFNTPADIGGAFVEVVAPGAFASTLKTSDVRALINHNPDLVLGRVSANTLRLAEDGTGLRFQLSLPDSTLGRDTAESVRRRDVAGCSFAFVVGPDGDEWSLDATGRPLRTLRAVDLMEMSLCGAPAYPATTANLTPSAPSPTRSTAPARPPATSASGSASLTLAERRLALMRRRYPGGRP